MPWSVNRPSDQGLDLWIDALPPVEHWASRAADRLRLPCHRRTKCPYVLQIPYVSEKCGRPLLFCRAHSGGKIAPVELCDCVVRQTKSANHGMGLPAARAKAGGAIRNDRHDQ